MFYWSLLNVILTVASILILGLWDGIHSGRMTVRRLQRRTEMRSCQDLYLGPQGLWLLHYNSQPFGMQLNHQLLGHRELSKPPHRDRPRLLRFVESGLTCKCEL
jgi:hypothetical protein